MGLPVIWLSVLGARTWAHALIGRSACGFTSPGGSGSLAHDAAGVSTLGVWPAEAAVYQPGSGSLGSRVVLLSHAREDAPAIADRDALVLRPGPDVRAALTARHGPPGAAPLPPARPAGVLDERRELPAERISVHCAQVYLVVGAAEPEPHRLIRRASIEIFF